METKTIKEKFQEFIISHREALKGKERDISRAIGVHFNTVYNYLDGFHPNDETCQKIMDQGLEILQLEK